MTRPHVFVSRPAVVTREQAALERRSLGHLVAVGFEPVTVVRRDYAQVPWHQLRRAIEGSDGALVMGFRQLQVQDGCWRPKTPEAVPVAGWYGTVWNHLEAGLAIMADIPLLVAPQRGVREGVFSSDTWDGVVHGVSIEDLAGAAEPLTGSARRTVDAWADAVRTRASAKPAPLP